MITAADLPHAELLDLAAKIEAHVEGAGAGANTTAWRCTRIQSRLGRAMAAHLSNLAQLRTNLRDLFLDIEDATGFRIPLPVATPSAATAAMARHAQTRDTDNRVRPIAAAARVALVAYLQERVDLMDEAERTVERHARWSWSSASIARVLARRVRRRALVALDELERPAVGAAA